MKEVNVKAEWVGCERPKVIESGDNFTWFKLQYGDSCVYYGLDGGSAMYLNRRGKVCDKFGTVLYEIDYKAEVNHGRLGRIISVASSIVCMTDDLKSAFQNQLRLVAEDLFIKEIIIETIKDNFDEINKEVRDIVPAKNPDTTDYSDTPSGRLSSSIWKFFNKDSHHEPIPAGGYECYINPKFKIYTYTYTYGDGKMEIMDTMLYVKMATLCSAIERFVSEQFPDE